MKRLLSLLGWSLATCVCLGGGRGVPAQEGIGNFGKVNEGLYRGAQPDQLGLRNLQRLGVKTIVNLRLPGESWKQEEAEARNCGMNYTNVPMKGIGRPTNEQIRTVLAIIETAAPPVFVHCEHGCDRTGTVIACYRIRHDGWSSGAALQEAKRYGMSKWEGAMKRYVFDFGNN